MNPEPSAPRVPGLRLRRVCGRGAGGIVYAAVREADGREVAVKVVGTAADTLDRVRREIGVLATVRAPGLVRLSAVTATNDGRVALVLDLVDGGVLRDVVADRGHLTARETVGVLRTLLAALAALHERGIAHGDLSAGNVLVSHGGAAVLADLGSAALAGERHREVWATRGFVAPELVSGGSPTPASDMYGVGALAWLMLSGSVPGHALGRRPVREVLPGCPAAIVDLVVRCLAGEPGERPSAPAAMRFLDGLAGEPLALPDGPDLGGRLTTRRGPATGPLGAGEWPGFEDAVVVGSDRDEPPPWVGSGPGASAFLPPVGPRGRAPADAGAAPRTGGGRHRGRGPGRLAVGGARFGRALTGATGRSLLASAVGVAVGLTALLCVQGWPDGSLPGRASVPPIGIRPPGGPPADGPGVGPPARVPTPSPPEVPREAASMAPSQAPSQATTRPTPEAGPGPDGRSGPGAERTAPARALPGLLAARARAYGTADVTPLESCYAPGTADHRVAQSDVRGLAAARRRLPGLAYTVREARLLRVEQHDGRPEATVAARVRTYAGAAADDVGDAGSGDPGPADAGPAVSDSEDADSGDTGSDWGDMASGSGAKVRGSTAAGGAVLGSAEAAGTEIVVTLRWTEAGWRVVTIGAG